MKTGKEREKKTRPIQIRLEPSLYDFVHRYVAEKHTTVSQLFRDHIVRLMASEKRKG